jgi:hypothetical protein
MKFNARLDTSHHGPSHPFKDAGVVAVSLTGIHNANVMWVPPTFQAPANHSLGDVHC